MLAQFGAVEMILGALHSTNKKDLKFLISADAQLSLCFKLAIKGNHNLKKCE